MSGVDSAERDGSAPWGRERALVGLGGLALGVCPFFTWIHVALLGDLTLFQLLRAEGHSTALAWIAVLLGCGMAVAAVTDSDMWRPRMLVLAVGVLGGAYAVLVLAGLVDATSKADGLASVGYGPLVGVAGCAALIVAGWSPRRGALDSPAALPQTQIDPVVVAQTYRRVVEREGVVILRAGALMGAFGVVELRQAAREEIAAQLWAVGLRTEPSLGERRITARTQLRLLSR